MDADVRYSLAGNNGAESSLHTKKNKNNNNEQRNDDDEEGILHQPQASRWFLPYLFIYFSER